MLYIDEGVARRLNTALCAGHLLAFVGVVTALIQQDMGWGVPVVLRYNVWTRVGEALVLHPGEDVLVQQFRPGIVLSLCSLVSGLHHLYAARHTRAYLLEVRSGFTGPRWIDYAISAPLMVVANETLWYAPADVNTLAQVALLQMLIVVAGAAAESWWSTDRRGVGLVFGAASVAFLWMWGRLWWMFARGPGAPLFVVVILALLTASFAVFPALLLFKLCGGGGEARHVHYEALFWLASALAKIPLLTFFGSGIVMRRGRVGVGSAPLPTDEASHAGLWWAGAATGLTIGTVLFLLRNSFTAPRQRPMGPGL